MDKDFLLQLGLPEESVQPLLDAYANDLSSALQQQSFHAAVKNALSRVKFSSKAAERDFTAAVLAKHWELQDGELAGFEPFLQERRSAEPDAFAPSLPVPSFVAPTGIGPAPDPLPDNIRQAKQIGALRADAARSSRQVLKSFL